MTIENLHNKIEKDGTAFVPIKKEEVFGRDASHVNDSIDKKADKALKQLADVYDFVDLFREFNEEY